MRPLLCLPLALALVFAASCADRQAPAQPQVIPAGKGNWVTVEEQLPLEGLVGKELSLPYRLVRAGSTATSAVQATAIFAATPLTPADRCGLELVRLRVTSADGSLSEVPAAGYVVDNSDGQRGFRVELSRNGEHPLVIPAGASAAVHFTQEVVLPAGGG